MNPFKAFGLWMHNFFISVPVEQIVATVGEEAVIEIAQCDDTIRRQQFVRHLANYKLEAVKTWTVKP